MAERIVLTGQGSSIGALAGGASLESQKAAGRTGAALRFRLGAIGGTSALREQGAQRVERRAVKLARAPLAAVAIVSLVMPVSSSAAGIYSGPTDTTHAIDAAIPSNSSRFVEWANAIQPLGPSTNVLGTYFAPRGATAISTTTFNSLGDLDATQIANGDSPGFLTVTFPSGIRNGAGADFAVFENGIVFPSDPNLFAEFAYVEVSSDGVHFARFASISTNTTWEGGFGQSFPGFDVTNVHNLAGKHAEGFGTPFDLAELAGSPLIALGQLNLNNIQYVKLVDIPGSGAFLDSEGHPILDAWLTNGTGGFDFRLPEGQGIG